MLNPIIVFAYSLIIIAGGVVGFIKAHSMPSLIMSSLFGVLLLLCTWGMWKKVQYSTLIANVLTSTLFVFFAYRYFIKMLFIPAGLISLLSLAVMLLLTFNKTKEETHWDQV